MKIFKAGACLFTLTVFLAFASYVFAGLGISPSQMRVPNLLRGSHVERTFVLSRSDPTEDLYFTVTTEGSTKNWTTLDKGTKFTMPKGQKRFSVVVFANIPKNAANGQYKGGIRLVSTSKAPKNITGSGASTSLAALIQTNFTVTGDQILEYKVLDIAARNIEEGSPLDIFLTLTNTGNVLARPTKVHVEVFDKLNKKKLESTDVTEMGSVEPFETGDIPIPVSTKLGKGQYWARVAVYKGKTVLMKDNMVFKIVEVGSLLKNGNLKEVILKKHAAVGEILKITAVFENIGKSNYFAKVVAEIYKNDKLFKIVEGDLITLKTGKTENLIAYFTPSTTGEYTVKTRVAYSGGRTEEKVSKVSVGNSGLFGLTLVQTAVVIFGAAVLAGAVYYKKKRKHHSG